MLRVTEAVLLRSLPVADRGRVVMLWGETRAGGWTNLPLPLDQVRQFQRRSQTLAPVASIEFRGAVTTPVLIGDRATQLRLGLVSDKYFEVIGTLAELVVVRRSWAGRSR